MDTKVTLSFDNEVIARAKKYAADNNISLSRLIEFLLNKVTSDNYRSLEDFPIAGDGDMVAQDCYFLFRFNRFLLLLRKIKRYCKA